MRNIVFITNSFGVQLWIKEAGKGSRGLGGNDITNFCQNHKETTCKVVKLQIHNYFCLLASLYPRVNPFIKIRVHPYLNNIPSYTTPNNTWVRGHLSICFRVHACLFFLHTNTSNCWHFITQRVCYPFILLVFILCKTVGSFYL